MAKRKRQQGHPARRPAGHVAKPNLDDPLAGATMDPAAFQRSLARAHEAGHGSGFIQGYMKALEDLFADDTINEVAHKRIAVHADPKENARYVLSLATKFLRPRSPEALKAGLAQALREHYAKIQPYLTPGVTVEGQEPDVKAEEEPPPGWERATASTG